MEYTKKKLLVLLGFIVMIACVALVILGQASVGYPGLGLMLLGLAGLLVLLYIYNRGQR